jgi:ribosome-binding factor A
VNEVLREVLAEELERLEDHDETLGLLTVTAVECEPDLRHALVLFSSLGEAEAEALARVRVRLQSAVAAQVRLKRTPHLSFAADPAVAAGTRVEDILRGLSATLPPAGLPSSHAPVEGDGSGTGWPDEPP